MGETSTTVYYIKIVKIIINHQPTQNNRRKLKKGKLKTTVI